MSKLKIYDLDVIERMTLREFNYRMYDKGEPVKFASEAKFEENKPKDLLQQIAELNK